MFRKISNLAIGFSFCVISSNALAFPMPNTKKITTQEFKDTNYHYDGIVGLSNCSGSLIQLEGAPLTDNAMILTNGHCLEDGMPEPNHFVSHQQTERSFDLLDDQSNTIGQVHAIEILYSTMTGTDITIYKLQETYQQIQEATGTHPLILSSKHPVAGTSIEVISGYWQRGFSCQIETFVDQLKEADWSFSDSIRYSRPGCEVIGGTSGSPVIEKGTRNVVGINNTVNENGRSCTMNNPCEVDSSGNVKYEKGLAYGQETYQIYTCINEAREFDLKLPSCKLFH